MLSGEVDDGRGVGGDEPWDGAVPLDADSVFGGSPVKKGDAAAGGGDEQELRGVEPVFVACLGELVGCRDGLDEYG